MEAAWRRLGGAATHLEAAHSLNIPDGQHHRQQGVQALVHYAHTVHKLGGPLAVAAVAVLEHDGADCTWDGIENQQGDDNGKLLIILEHHRCWEDDGTHQLTSASRHTCHIYRQT